MGRALPMIKKIIQYWDFLFIVIAALITRFWNIWYPAKVVFDEAHFGLYASKYLSGAYYWDIHPPLGKLFFTFAGFVGGLKPGFDFAESAFYPDASFIFMRCLAAFFGVALIVLVYFFTKKLGGSRRIAFFASFLLIFDNALLVESRFILLDIILVFFIIATLFFFLFFLEARPFSRKWFIFIFLTGVFGGAAMSIKWTGLAALGIVWIFLLFIDKNKTRIYSREMLLRLFSLIVLPLLVYISIFGVHFSLLDKECVSGCGYILEKFSVSDISPPQGSIVFKIIEENKRIFLTNALTTFDDMSYFASSQWFTWPVMLKPIPYYVAEFQNKTSFIYLLGNPFAWLFGLIGIFGYLFVFFKHSLKKSGTLPVYFSRLNILMIASCFYLFSFIMVKRPTLLYHYLFPLVISFIVFAFLFDYFLKIVIKDEKKIRAFCALVLLFVFAGFMFFAPLSYGLPYLTQEEFNLRMWLPTWRY